jgi:hypothetical protein
MNDPDDIDENGKKFKYAIKRIIPTLDAAAIVVEMLILKILDGQKNCVYLLRGHRAGTQVSLVFNYKKSQPFLSLL